MSFRNENAIGDEAIVRSGKLNSSSTAFQAIFKRRLTGEQNTFFMINTSAYGCTLLYIAAEFFRKDMQGIYYVILVSGLFLIIVNILIVYLLTGKFTVR